MKFHNFHEFDTEAFFPVSSSKNPARNHKKPSRIRTIQRILTLIMKFFFWKLWINPRFQNKLTEYQQSSQK